MKIQLVMKTIIRSSEDSTLQILFPVVLSHKSYMRQRQLGLIRFQ